MTEKKPRSEAQKAADRKYKQNGVHQVKLELYGTDADILEWLNQQGNKQGYIKALIRADMQKNSPKIPIDSEEYPK